jgi:hypothetical protein
MSSQKQSPAFFRYLKARLQPLGRPAFWVSAVGMSLVFLVIAKYWNDPEWFSRFGGDGATSPEGAAANSNLSPEELAALANIDSSSILLERFDPATALPTVPLPEADSGQSKDSDESGGPEGLLSQFSLGKPKSNAIPASNPSNTGQEDSNPFATSIQELLTAGSRFGSGLSTNATPNALATSPLAPGGVQNSTSGTSALNSPNANRSTSGGSSSANADTRASNPSSSGSEGQSPTNARRQTSPTLTSQGQFPSSYPSNNFSGGSAYNAAGQPNYPAYPAPGTTGYGAPPTTTTPQNSYQYLVPPVPTTGVPAPVPVTPGNFGQTPTQPSGQAGGFNNPNVNPPVGTSQIQPSQLSQPSPSPQRPIGQFGGGQINTFSNP